MGFPEIMYLSKSQVRTMWPSLDKKRFKLEEFSAKASLSLNPSAEFGGKWSSQKGTRGSKDDIWPPWDSGLVVEAIDAYITQDARVGLWSDLFDNPDNWDFYSLEGRLKCAGPSLVEEIMFGRFKAQSIDAVFCGELPTDRLRVSMSLENIAGIDRRDGEWEVWESGANYMLQEMQYDTGFESHGLFVLTDAKAHSAPFARMVYLARGNRNTRRRRH